jgi:hypothetical protein
VEDKIEGASSLNNYLFKGKVKATTLDEERNCSAFHLAGHKE